MRDLEALVTDKSFVGQQFAVGSHIYSVAKTDSFEYVDPVDGTVTKKQVLAGQSQKEVDGAKLVGKVCRAGEIFRGCLLCALHFEIRVLHLGRGSPQGELPPYWWSVD